MYGRSMKQRHWEVAEGLLVTPTPLVQSGPDENGLGTLQLLCVRSSMGGGWESIQDGERRVGGAPRHCAESIFG